MAAIVQGMDEVSQPLICIATTKSPQTEALMNLTGRG
jgi:hypothetical protein